MERRRRAPAADPSGEDQSPTPGWTDFGDNASRNADLPKVMEESTPEDDAAIDDLAFTRRDLTAAGLFLARTTPPAVASHDLPTLEASLNQAAASLEPALAAEAAGHLRASSPAVAPHLEVFDLEALAAAHTAFGALDQAARQVGLEPRPAPPPRTRPAPGFVAWMTQAREDLAPAILAAAPVSLPERTAEGVSEAQGAPYPRLETVWGERVLVGSAEEKTEAEGLFQALAQEHWLAIDSGRVVDLERSGFRGEAGVGEPELARLKDAPWTLEELRALYRAAEHFQPIQGPERQRSGRAGTWQELHLVGRMNHTLSPDPAGATPRHLLGEAAAAEHRLTFFSRASADDTDFPGDPARQREATLTHEMAHVVFADQLPDFVAATPYWGPDGKPAATSGVEAPPTDYARASPTEDLAETVMLYFNDPDRLRARCPERYAWVAGQVAAWAPSP